MVSIRAHDFNASRFPSRDSRPWGMCECKGGSAYLRLKFSKTQQRAQFCVSESPLFAAFFPGPQMSFLLTQAQVRAFLAQTQVRLKLPLSAFSIHCQAVGCSLAFERGGAESFLALHVDWRSDAIRAYCTASTERRRVASLLAIEPTPSPLL